MSGPSSSVFRSVRRPPRRRWLGTAKMVLAGVLVLVLLAAAIVGAVWAESWLRLGGTELASLSSDLEALGEGDARSPDRATTVLVAMMAEHDPTAARAAPLTADVALVQVSDRREETAVVLLPRSLRVGVDGEGDLPLSEVHERGGLDLLVRSVLDYTGVGLDHAVAATPEVLPALTDALGDVERCADAGCRILDADAVRLATTEGDQAERAEAAVDVLTQLAGRVGPDTPLRSPLRSRAVISVLSGEVVTDVSLRGRRLLGVAGALDASRPLSVVRVPGVRHPETDVFLVRPEQAEILFQHLRQGTSFDDGEVADDPEAVPELVTVAVLNGAGTAGLAGRVESQLQGAGYTVVGTDNAPSFDHDDTVISFHADNADAEVAAVLLAEQLGGVALAPAERPPSFEGDDVDLLVTVGHDLDEDTDDEGDD